MNEKIKKLAMEANFCFWSDEEWKPHGAIIDWSADYDREFQKYTELLIRECILVAIYKDDGMMHPANVAGYFAAGRSSAAQMIKQHFGIEE